MFAVIQVDDDYGHIENVECYAVFDTEEEANMAVLHVKERQQASGVAKVSYVRDFVSRIALPSLEDKNDWNKIYKRFEPLVGNNYLDPHRFRQRLEEHLMKYCEIIRGDGTVHYHPCDISQIEGLHDFEPPQHVWYPNELHVVEIKTQEKWFSF